MSRALSLRRKLRLEHQGQVDAPLIETSEVQHVSGACFAHCGWQTIELPEELQVFQRRELLVVRKLLEHHAEGALDLEQLLLDRDAIDERVAGSGLEVEEEPRGELP